MFFYKMSKELCRVCAKEHCLARAVKLFDKVNHRTLYGIKQITGIMLKNVKNLPHHMCEECQIKLELALDFRISCKRAQKYLRQAAKDVANSSSQDPGLKTPELHDNESEKSTELNIKSSPRLDNESCEYMHFTDTKAIETDLDTNPSRIENEQVDEKVLSFELEPEIELAIQQFESEDEKPLALAKASMTVVTESSAEDSLIVDENSNGEVNFVKVHDERMSTTHSLSADEDPDWNLNKTECKSNIKNETKLCKIKPKRKYEKKLKSIFKSSTEDVDVEMKRQKRNTLNNVENIKKERKSKNSATANEKETKYMCYLCGAPFYCLTYYNHHMNRHKGEKTFACDQCPQRFYTKQMLKRHSYHHTGVRPYACNYCPQTFVDHSARTRHERAHNNVRPYKCTECGKGFNTNYVLKNHILTHTGIREFNCALCQRSFVQKKHLETHYRSMFHKQNEEKAKTITT